MDNVKPIGAATTTTAVLNTARIPAMDSLRGLASLQVLIHHCLGMTLLFYNIGSFPSSETPFLANLFTFSPLHILWAGHEAVIFFFVMSGFVLSIPYFKRRDLDYLSFFVKRVFRIYAPYLVTILIGLILNSIYLGHQQILSMSLWVNGLFTKTFSASEVIDFIIFLKGDFPSVVTSLWSLPVELKLSLIFPIIILALATFNRKLTLAIPIVNVIFYHVGKKLGMQELWSDFALFYYLSFFLFGAVLAKYRNLILPSLNRLSKNQLLALVLLSILVYTYTWIIVWAPVPLYNVAVKVPADYVTCFAGLLLIMLSMTDKLNDLLSKKYLIELGRISFSLYLIHPLVIAVISIQLGNLIPVYASVFLSIVISLVLSFPFHYLIEWPLQKFGRRLGDQLKSKP